MPFEKGKSGNESGRPRGSRNKTMLAMEVLLDGQMEALTQKAISLALDGDVTALKVCIDRLLPVRKDRPVTVGLPTIQTTEDIVKATAKITEAVGVGILTPGEAELISKILENHRRAVETTELEKRLTALEARSNQK